MNLERLVSKAHSVSLEVIGLCHTVPDDGLGDGTLALLGPYEPEFWQVVTETPEFQDGKSDPLDRWSTRVVSQLAEDVDGKALFPFGLPARPFIGWALRSKRAWQSPVGLLVHDTAGLLVSYRGAILLDERFELPTTGEKPCHTCITQDCLTACPAHALIENGYDIPACHNYLSQAQGEACLMQGCAVRRACPVSQRYPRVAEQSAFHMAAFHKPDQRDNV